MLCVKGERAQINPTKYTTFLFETQAFFEETTTANLQGASTANLHVVDTVVDDDSDVVYKCSGGFHQ